MKPEEIRALVIEVIAETFEADASVIHDATVADDVDGWDSLGHTVLMIRLGKRLGRGVPESIASEAKNVGLLIAMLTSHMSAG